MGGEIGPILAKKSPRFAVLAMKDPGGNGEPSTPLQRIQIVKGWVDPTGQAREVVYDVAGDPENGATVDLDKGSAAVCVKRPGLVAPVEPDDPGAGHHHCSAAPRRREVVLVQPGDVDIGASRLPHRSGPLAPQPRKPRFKRRALQPFDAHAGTAEALHESIELARVLVAADLERTARAEETVLAQVGA
jgi:hypothetical protein